MAVSFVAATSANTGTVSQSAVSAMTPAAAALLDVALLHVVAERGDNVLPSVPAGWTTLFSGTAAANDMVQTIAWRRLKAADLGATVSSAVSTGRRMGLTLSVYRGAADPVLTGPVYSGGGAATSTITSPSVTPTSGDAMLVGLLAAAVVISPYVRTWSADSPYTLRASDSSAAPSSVNATAAVATQLLSGGAGSSQVGATFICSDPSFHSWSSTVVLAPGAPTGLAPEPQVDVEPGEPVQLVPTGTGAWVQTSGPAVTLAGSGTTKTFDAPYTISGVTLGFTFAGDPTSVTVLPATERAVVGSVEVPVKWYVA